MGVLWLLEQGIQLDGNGTNGGHVRVYENISGTWTQIGSSIDTDGEAVIMTFSERTVSLSKQ